MFHVKHFLYLNKSIQNDVPRETIITTYLVERLDAMFVPFVRQFIASVKVMALACRNFPSDGLPSRVCCFAAIPPQRRYDASPASIFTLQTPKQNNLLPSHFFLAGMDRG